MIELSAVILNKVKKILDKVDPALFAVSGSVVSDAGNTASTFKTDLPSTVSGFYNNLQIVFKTGNNSGQSRRIYAYNGSTKFITVDTAFSNVPSADDRFNVIPRFTPAGGGGGGDATLANQELIKDGQVGDFNATIDSLHDIRGKIDSGLDVAVSTRPSGADYTSARAAKLDNLDALVSSRAPETGGNLAAVKTDIDNMQITMPFPSGEAKDDVSVITATDTTEKTITVSLPSGASIVRVMLAALITIINRSANAQDIDIDVKGRVSGGGWNVYFSQTDVISLPNVDKASAGLVALQDVSALVTAAGTYGFKLTVTLSSANTVRFVTQYLLSVTYKMS